ncbi:hypothetical protein ABK040_012095 [Willaertia magna]
MYGYKLAFSNKGFYFIILIFVLLFSIGIYFIKNNNNLNNKNDKLPIIREYNISNPLNNIKIFIEDIAEYGNRIPNVSIGYYKTLNYINNTINKYTNLYTIEYDTFIANTPIFGNLEMNNIIITFNPNKLNDSTLQNNSKNNNSKNRIILSCHYETKYFQDATFIGATDSLVPLGMILNFLIEFESIYNQTILNNIPNKDINDILKKEFQIVLFDGEEAFLNWSPTDSLYGSKHLTQKWKIENKLTNIEYLLLLDLIGTNDINFNNYYIHQLGKTNHLYQELVNIEINKFGKFKYFNPKISYSMMEDDHIPFLRNNVPIIHLISEPFPMVWHTLNDDLNHLDYNSINRIYLVIREFLLKQLLNN